jgi:hypothetical protein
MRDYFTMLMNSEAAFSTKARYGCIADGKSHLVRLLRTLQLPVLTAVEHLLGQMASMGDVIAGTPAIFGYNECGDTDGTPGEANYGQGQLATQKMLGRYNMPFRLMKYYLEGDTIFTRPRVAQEGFTIDLLLPPGNANPTASQMITHFEGLFGVTLSTPERAIMMEFLDPPTGSRPRWSTNATVTPYVTYDPANDGPLDPRGRMTARISLLVTLFSTLADTNVR